MTEQRHSADTVVMTEAWENGCDHHCGCTFVLLALAEKLAEALRRHAHGGTDCGLCDEALSEYHAARIDGSPCPHDLITEDNYGDLVCGKCGHHPNARNDGDASG